MEIRVRSEECNKDKMLGLIPPEKDACNYFNNSNVRPLNPCSPASHQRLIIPSVETDPINNERQRKNAGECKRKSH